MQRIFFEQSSFLIIPCALLAAAVASFLYRGRHPWIKRINLLLAGLRFTAVFFLLLLLLGPVVKLVLNQTSNPVLVFLVDHSKSVFLQDSVKAKKLLNDLREKKSGLESAGYDVRIRDLEGNENPDSFSGKSSDLNTAIQKTETDLEDEHLTSIVLISDGIFNNGISPLYSSSAVPIHTIAVGDTLQRKDIRIRQLQYNKVAYRGNKFPVRAEIIAGGIDNEDTPVTMKVLKDGKTIETREVRIGLNGNYLTADFLLPADKPGLVRYDVIAEPVNGEFNLQNNKMTAILEVVDSKKQILIMATAPHPDIRAIRSVLEKNEHYTVNVHIPGVQDSDPFAGPALPDVVIFHQIPDQRNSSRPYLEKIMKDKIPAFFIIGQQSAVRQIPAAGIPVTFETAGQWDEVYGAPAQQFELFKIPDQTADVLNRMPPLITPFGKFTMPADVRPLLMQRIGNVLTNRPLLFTVEKDDHRMAVLTAEGIWRWRMKEFQFYEKTVVFDDIFSKMIQYLGTPEDKRKFRCFPVQRNFSEGRPAVIEFQIFDEVFQPEFGIPVQLEITGENGQKQSYNFTPDPSRRSLSLNLPEGIYRYRAIIERNGKKEVDSGNFSVLPGDRESQDLTADFDLLRRLSKSSGGKFFNVDEMNNLGQWFEANPPPARVRSDESLYPLVDLLWVFFLLMAVVGLEWGVRKAEGGY
ncbi:MAG: vWA domain-containing protein [Cyclobacteriaceae bacterium]